MFARKIIAGAVSVSLLVNMAMFPVSTLAAGPKEVSSSSIRIWDPIPTKLKDAFAEQKAYLKSIGNPKEYESVKLNWDEAKWKPSHIRDIKKRSSKDLRADTKKILQDYSAVYGARAGKIPASLDIRLSKEEVSRTSKKRHARLQEYYNGLRIVDGEMITHVNENGEIYQIDGSYDPNVSISTIPKVSASEAVAVAEREHAKERGFAVSKEPELVVYPYASSYLLAWEYSVKNDNKEAWTYYVDANSGKSLDVHDLVKHDGIVTLTGSRLTGEGSGTASFTGYLQSGVHYIFANDMFVYNASTNTGAYVDADTIASRNGSNWGTTDRTEVSAAANIQKTLQYFNTFGFGIGDIAFSSSGQTQMPVFVHYGTNYNNAFWYSGDGMYFWDGDGVNYGSFAALDVSAHEFGHAWTENTSNLVYKNEAGALNESFSDIVGTSVEFYDQQSAADQYPNKVAGKADWLIGEDLSLGSTALRDMRNPGNTAVVGIGGEQPSRYKGTYWSFDPTYDHGGVHVNSWVQNFFYYLLSEGGKGVNDGVVYSVDGIGINNARQIAYEANSHFLTSSATYKDARQAWIDAANAINPAFVPSVEAAWDAVDVGREPAYSVLSVSDESFENSTSLPANWTTSGTGWTVSTSTGSFGANSLVSGDINNSEESSVSWQTATHTGSLAFAYRTSSEAGYDFLKLFVDGEQKASWSGETPWTLYSEPITGGNHTFTWTYQKDNVVSSGADLAGIDSIKLVSLTGSIEITSPNAHDGFVSGSGLAVAVSPDGTGSYVMVSSGGLFSARGTMNSSNFSIPVSGLPDGAQTIYFQYRNQAGFLSPILTKTFTIDSIAPGMPTVTSPVTGTISNTGTVALIWNPVTDNGSGVREYHIEVSNNEADFNAGVYLNAWSTSTGQTLALNEGTNFVRVKAVDNAGNASAPSAIVKVTVDSVKPNAPSVTINGGNVIDSTTQSNVAITGSAPSESGSTMFFTISDGNSNVSGSAIVGSDGAFSTAADVTSLADGMLNYDVTITDQAGNVSTSATGSIGKSMAPANASVTFLSGSHTNSNLTTIRITSNAAGSFTLSGSAIFSDGTGTVNGGTFTESGSIDLTASFNSGDGLKTAEITFTDAIGIISHANAFITLDQTAPVVSILSHSDNQTVTDASVILTGTVTDLTPGYTLSINGNPVTLSGTSWWTAISLSAGDNPITYESADSLWNVSSGSINLRRIADISHVSKILISESEVEVRFSTSLASTGYVAYGTDSGSLGTTTEELSSNVTEHSIALSGLTPDTVYYFQAYGKIGSYEGVRSATGTFRTPKLIDTSSPISDTVNATGSVAFSGSTGTGVEFSGSTGSITLYSDDGSNSVTLSLSGLSITATGSTSWNGIIEAPKNSSLSGVSINDAGYSQTGSIYSIGSDSNSLQLSSEAATVSIAVGSQFNGKTLRVYRSSDAVTFWAIGSCTVTSGTCTFTTNHFSYFAFGAPTDTVPDTFSFTSQTNAELGTQYVSSVLTVSGINAPSPISIVGSSMEYSINNGAYTAISGNVSNGDTVKIRGTSSSNYFMTVSATLTIGGTTWTYSITTKSAPVSSGGGGGGSSGGSSTTINQDSCPNGDNSGNLYDGNCGSQVVTTSTEKKVEEKKTEVKKTSGTRTPNIPAKKVPYKKLLLLKKKLVKIVKPVVQKSSSKVRVPNVPKKKTTSSK